MYSPCSYMYRAQRSGNVMNSSSSSAKAFQPTSGAVGRVVNSLALLFHFPFGLKVAGYSWRENILPPAADLLRGLCTEMHLVT